MTSPNTISCKRRSTPWANCPRRTKKPSSRRSKRSRRAQGAQRFASAASEPSAVFAKHSGGSMESAELKRTEVRARRAYEWTRVGRAAAAFAPVLLLVIAAALIGERGGYVLAFGSVRFGLGLGLLWYGCSGKRAVLPGRATRLVPR